jgi:hypothetical protein
MPKMNYLFSVITGPGIPVPLFPTEFSIFLINGLKKSRGIGNIVVELFSVAISRSVCR